MSNDVVVKFCMQGFGAIPLPASVLSNTGSEFDAVLTFVQSEIDNDL